MAISAAPESVGTPHPASSELPPLDQLCVHYQPQVDLRTGGVVAAEALLRWAHPTRGILTPAVFLPALTEAGLIGAVTRRVTRETVAQQHAWALDGLVMPVSINVPASMLANDEWRAELLALRRPEGCTLTLEVTEGERLPELPEDALQTLVEAGYRLSVDDLGQGFASIDRLATMPVSEVKIDIAMVRLAATSSRHRALVAALYRVATELGLRVVAEGVETEELRVIVRECGVTIGQGWLFAPALPADAFAAMAASTALPLMPRRRASDALPAIDSRVPQRVDSSGMGSRRVRELQELLAAPLRPIVASLPRWAVAIAAINLVGYLAWQVSGVGGPEQRQFVGDVLFWPINSLAVLAAILRVRREPAGRGRWTWALVAGAMTSYLAGDVAQWYSEAVLHHGYPRLADVCYLTFYPLMFIGLLSMPALRKVATIDRLTMAVDVGIVTLGGVAVIWYLVLGPNAVAGERSLDVVIATAYPVGDIIVLIAVVTQLVRHGVAAAQALRILAAAMVVYMLTDVIYGWVSLHGTYQGGAPVDTGWIVAITLVFLAAVSRSPVQLISNGTTSRRGARLPYAAVALGYALLAVATRRTGLYPVGGLLLIAVCMTLLVSLRQVVLLRENRLLLQRYRALAATDSLTGLYNRRRLIELAEERFTQAGRFGTGLVALMIDVDHFKTVNDSFGHATGDQVLATVAMGVQATLRAGDLLGRYGGDELVAILDGVDSAHALVVARRIKQRFDNEPVLTASGPVYTTLSIGIAEESGCRTIEGLLAKADSALYAAKSAGRDCARMATA